MNEDKEMEWLFCFYCYEETGEKIQMYYEREEPLTRLDEPEVKWYARVFRCPRCQATEEFPHREGEECVHGSLISLDNMMIEEKISFEIIDDDTNEDYEE